MNEIDVYKNFNNHSFMREITEEEVRRGSCEYSLTSCYKYAYSKGLCIVGYRYDPVCHWALAFFGDNTHMSISFTLR